LRQRFELAYGDVLPLASDSHIYTALNELQRRGLIEEDPVIRASQSGTDRQPRPRYRATSEGAHGYREWMLAQVSRDRHQTLLFVRQLAVLARAGEPDVALQILESLEQACLKETRKTPPVALPDSRSLRPASGLADRLVLEESRLAMEARLPWIHYARKEFKALEQGSGR
jgi:DNA-binding PadR family transcriptional regulator